MKNRNIIACAKYDKIIVTITFDHLLISNICISFCNRFIISNLYHCWHLFMPPTLKKLEGHIAFGLSVCVCVGGWVRLLTFEP